MIFLRGIVFTVILGEQNIVKWTPPLYDFLRGIVFTVIPGEQNIVKWSPPLDVFSQGLGVYWHSGRTDHRKVESPTL